MALYDSGFSIVLANVSQALAVPQASPQPAVLHFVGVEVEYVPQALVGPAGEQIAGVKVKIGDLLTATLDDYYTSDETDAAISSAISATITDYVPLSDVATVATGDKVARRNIDGEIFGSTFRPSNGGGLRGVSDTASVVMETNALVKGVEVKGTSPSGGVLVGLFGVDPIARPAGFDLSGYADRYSTVDTWVEPTTLSEANTRIHALTSIVATLIDRLTQLGALTDV